MAASPAEHSPKGFLHILFIIFIGLLVAILVGLGVQAFYPAPKYPDSPAAHAPLSGTPPQLTEEETKRQQGEWKQTQDDFQAKTRTYNRNAAAAVLALAIIVLVLSLTVLARTYLINDGFMLGGILTLFYSIIRSLMSENAKLQFAIVLVGLAVTVGLAYVRFVRPVKKDATAA